MKDEELYKEITRLANKNKNYYKLNKDSRMDVIHDSLISIKRKWNDGTVPKDNYDDYAGYLFIIIMNNIKKQLNNKTEKKNKENLENNDRGELNDDESYINPTWYELSSLIKDLGELDYNIVMLLLEGYKSKEISIKFETSETFIRSRVNELREKYLSFKDIKYVNKKKLKYHIKNIQTGEIKIFLRQIDCIKYCKVSTRTLYYAIKEQRIMKEIYKVKKI